MNMHDQKLKAETDVASERQDYYRLESKLKRVAENALPLTDIDELEGYIKDLAEHVLRTHNRHHVSDRDLIVLLSEAGIWSR